ncbi:hypothetical protein ACH42_04065 [Endozoicomonas sp. (ex Bugula neritina AB1)]|nr:hypothetical protein ACH42_04065 [Endozoicomonas sp. (ex Bugula neritina AB1)]
MEYASIESLNHLLPVQSVHCSWLSNTRVEVDILRLDLLHPDISGNKWFKLKHNIIEARRQGMNTLLSFGGAWSNHIHALSAAGKHLGMSTIGVIRGERSKTLSDTLKDAEQWGMRLHFVTRKAYREKQTELFRQQIFQELELPSGSVWWVPEGGNNALGAKGCEDILASGDINPKHYQQIWLACGTGATLAGVAHSAKHTLVTGIPVLKRGEYLKEGINQYISGRSRNWRLLTEHHCGGYAKVTPELSSFITGFERETNIPLDPVYTGKAMLALKKTIEAGRIEKESRVLMIHTGGLQGKRGF